MDQVLATVEKELLNDEMATLCSGMASRRGRPHRLWPTSAEVSTGGMGDRVRTLENRGLGACQHPGIPDRERLLVLLQETREFLSGGKFPNLPIPSEGRIGKLGNLPPRWTLNGARRRSRTLCRRSCSGH